MDDPYNYVTVTQLAQYSAPEYHQRIGFFVQIVKNFNKLAQIK